MTRDLVLLGGVLQAALRALGRIRTEGFEHFPRHAPFILASNHVSYLDSLLLLSFVSLHLDTVVAPAATKGLFVFPLSLILSRIGAIPLDRGSGDNVENLRRILHTLRTRPILIFPEGGRVRPGVVRTPRPGLGFLALTARVPVVPVRVSGTDRVARRWPRRTAITIRAGSPLCFRKEDYAGVPSVRSRVDVVEQVMAAISRL